eukprot:6146379-Pyramimonas_sp.AAC.1
MASSRARLFWCAESPSRAAAHVVLIHAKSSLWPAASAIGADPQLAARRGSHNMKLKQLWSFGKMTRCLAPNPRGSDRNHKILTESE